MVHYKSAWRRAIGFVFAVGGVVLWQTIIK